MAIKRKYYQLAANGTNYSVKLPETYDDVNAQLGLTAIADDATTKPAPLSTADLLKNGWAIKIRILRKVTINGNVRYKSHDLLCAIGSVATALTTLETKTYGTGLAGGKVDIINAYIGRRRRRS